jgi:WD40 repeat protein
MLLRSSRFAKRCFTGVLLLTSLLLVMGLVARLTPLKPRLTVATGHDKGVIEFSPDGTTLACVHVSPGNKKDTIRLWNIEKGIEKLALEPVEYFVDNVEFTPDGKRLVAFGRSGFDGDGGFVVWDVDSGAELAQQVFKGVLRDDPEVRLSPDGRLLAYPSGDGTPERETIAFLDLRTGLKLGSIPGSFRSLVFSPDGTTAGTTLASSLSGKISILLWNLSDE